MRHLELYAHQIDIQLDKQERHNLSHKSVAPRFPRHCESQRKTKFGKEANSTEKTNSDGLYVFAVEVRVESSASEKPAEKLNVNVA